MGYHGSQPVRNLSDMSAPRAKWGIRYFWTGLVLLIAGSCFFSNTAACKIRTLSGHVTYRERMVLPPSAMIEVRLVDVSRADGKAITIAATSISGSNPGSVSLSVAL